MSFFIFLRLCCFDGGRSHIRIRDLGNRVGKDSAIVEKSSKVFLPSLHRTQGLFRMAGCLGGLVQHGAKSFSGLKDPVDSGNILGKGIKAHCSPLVVERARST